MTMSHVLVFWFDVIFSVLKMEVACLSENKYPRTKLYGFISQNITRKFTN